MEVRWSDFGWGRDNDRNLVGKFTMRSFTVPRLGRVQDHSATTPRLRDWRYDGAAPGLSAVLRKNYNVNLKKKLTRRSGCGTRCHLWCAWVHMSSSSRCWRKLGRLEANVEMLVGDGNSGGRHPGQDLQPGAQAKIRRSVYDKIYQRGDCNDRESYRAS